MAIIKAQQPNGEFREVCRCADDMIVVQRRMSDAARQYRGQRIRAEDASGRLIDTF